MRRQGENLDQEKEEKGEVGGRERSVGGNTGVIQVKCIGRINANNRDSLIFLGYI